jgi:glycosyltransferase involved in cell wall biosynthesis
MSPNRNERPLFVFGWPSNLGGADTKLVHLLILLREHCDITVVPNENRHLHNKTWTRFLDGLGVKYALIEKLPAKLAGIGLAMSNQCFFTHRIAQRAKERGLKIVWSSEMMWHHEGELDAVRAGVVDKVLYTSEFQRSALSPGYGDLPSAITGNYIDPSHFPFKERQNQMFAIGRLSRADPLKYPEDFPVFYEALKLPEVRFRVMAWDEKLSRKYRWHRFDRRWDLLPPEKERVVDFLQSLDLFVYPLGHKFRESWGRSTVEAMLTGCIPIVPRGHQFENLMVHGKSGFICGDFLEYKDCCQTLFFDLGLRKSMSVECRRHAEVVLCNRTEHRARWLSALFGDTAVHG